MRFLSFVCLTMVVSQLFASQPDKKMFIALNIADCRSCLLGADFLLKKIDKYEKMTWVLPEIYKGQNSVIENRLKIRLDGELLFCDSLYNRLTKYSKGSSFFMFSDGEVVDSASFSNLKEAQVKVASYFQEVSNEVLFTLPDTILIPPQSDIKTINDSNLVIVDKVFNELYFINTESSHIYKLDPDELFSREAYSAVFEDTITYSIIEKHIDTLEAYGYNSVFIKNIAVENDEIYLLCQFPFIIEEGGNVTVSFTHGIAILNCNLLPKRFISLKKHVELDIGQEKYYNYFSFFRKHKDKLYLLYWPDSRKEIVNDVHFVASIPVVGEMDQTPTLTETFIPQNIANILSKAADLFIVNDSPNFYHYLLPFQFNLERKGFRTLPIGNIDSLDICINELVEHRVSYCGSRIIAVTSNKDYLSILYVKDFKYHKVVLESENLKPVYTKTYGSDIFEDNGGVNSMVSSLGWNEVLYIDNQKRVVRMNY